MNSAELQDFVDNRMRMSHVYQPLVIRCLLDAGSQATLRQLAIEFAKEDEAQLRDYEKRIKAMPLRVLRQSGKWERATGFHASHTRSSVSQSRRPGTSEDRMSRPRWLPNLRSGG